MRKTLIFLLSSLVFVSTAFAAEKPTQENDKVFRVQKENVELTKEENMFIKVGNSVGVDGKVDSKALTKNIANGFVSSGINAYLQGKNAKDWMRRTEVQFSFQNNWKPLYAIETIQPLYENQLSTVFTQARLSNGSDIGTTANLGFGYRRVNKANTSLYGINMFYDHGFRNSHARIGLGLEYFTGYHELNANIYKGVSGEKLVDRTNNIFEKVVDGYDVEYGFTIPKAQWAKIYLQGFSWDYKHSKDVTGYRISTQMQLTPHLSVELGYIDESSRKGEKFAKIMVNLADRKVSLFGKKEAKIEQDKQVNVINISEKRLQKVRRQNEIRVERYQKDAAGNVIKGFNFKIGVRA